MATQNVELTDHQADFIRASVDGGHYRDAGEVLRAGLRLLEERDRLYQAKLERLRRTVRDGFEEIERGEFVTITPETLDDFMDSESPTRRKQSP